MTTGLAAMIATFISIVAAVVDGISVAIKRIRFEESTPGKLLLYRRRTRTYKWYHGVILELDDEIKTKRTMLAAVSL